MIQISTRSRPSTRFRPNYDTSIRRGRKTCHGTFPPPLTRYPVSGQKSSLTSTFLDLISTRSRPDLDRISTKYSHNLDQISTRSRPDLDQISTESLQNILTISTRSRPNRHQISTIPDLYHYQISTRSRPDLDQISTRS